MAKKKKDAPKIPKKRELSDKEVAEIANELCKELNENPREFVKKWITGQDKEDLN